MRFDIRVEDSASDALGKITPNVRAALRKALDPLARQLTQDVRARALSHIHTFGKAPGLYLASIFGGVSDKGDRVTGYVRSGNPLAHLLEFGVADTGAHEIVGKAGGLLHFLDGASEVYARIVHHPGATIPAYPVFGPALEARQGQIEVAIKDAVATAAAQTRA